MSGAIQFETPENIQVSYQPAGLGTRFVAWVVDYIVLMLAMICIAFLIACSGVISATVLDDLFIPMQQMDPEQVAELPMYLVGVIVLIFGLGSFFYYGLSELFMHGQTLGKRQMGLRVVKVDGFSLSPGSVLIRNVFRVADHIPVLWIVPLVSARSQRLGDMVAGTVVVSDRPEDIGSVREVLGRRPAVESKFRFDVSTLKRARRQDVSAVERILERWHQLPEDQRQSLLNQVVEPLAKRLETELPEPADYRAYLEDFLAAEYRRQYRKLG